MARLFVSDLHLDAGAPAAIERFCAFLRTHAAGAEALYILGDLFESWIGDDDPAADELPVCAALRTLTAGGVACFALHGNRDFLLGLPHNARALHAGAARAGSRAHTARTTPYLMDVNSEAVAAAYRATGVRRIIHGHTHRPGVHEMLLDGTPTTRLVLGAWYEQGSYLRYEQGRYELRELTP